MNKKKKCEYDIFIIFKKIFNLERERTKLRMIKIVIRRTNADAYLFRLYKNS